MLARKLVDDVAQPLRPWLLKPRYIDVFRRKAKIARKHQRGTTVDRNLHARASSNGGAADLVEGLQQLLSIQRSGHAYRLAKRA